MKVWDWLFHGSGSLSPASHRGDPVSRPAQSMWDLWWTELALGQVFLRVLWVSPVGVLPPWLHTHISFGVWTIGLLVAAVQRHSLTAPTRTATTRMLLTRSPGFVPRTVHGRFVIEKVVVGKISLQVHRFSPVSIFLLLLHIHSRLVSGLLAAAVSQRYISPHRNSNNKTGARQQ
jgi:hypothetical protein